MNLNRSIERFLIFVLNECCPAVLRDSRLFMWLPFRIAFGSKARYFFDFKDNAARYQDSFLKEAYEKTSSVSIQDEGTDLSGSILKIVQSNVLGKSVLDAGCGQGKLAGILSSEHSVTACDIILDESAVNKLPDVSFREAGVENLPFDDGEFDTVTCTHTLEHIWDVNRAVSELRRVAAKRMIVVVPKERPYRYSFNLHLHFFLFEYQLHQLFQGRDPRAPFVLREIDNCWYYHEDRV